MYFEKQKCSALYSTAFLFPDKEQGMCYNDKKMSDKKTFTYLGEAHVSLALSTLAS